MSAPKTPGKGAHPAKAIRDHFADPLNRAEAQMEQAVHDARAHTRAVNRVRKIADRALAAHGDNRDAVLTEITQALIKQMSAVDQVTATAVLGELLPPYLATRAAGR